MILSLPEKRLHWFLAIVFPIACFLYFFPDYMIKHTFFWVCLATLPISIIRNESSRFPFFGLCLFLGIVGTLLPTKIGAYVYVCAMILFVVQQKLGGIHIIGLIHAFLASPFFTYLSNLISFPIRIQLSKVVSLLLGLTGFENTSSGNIIILNDQEFLVDQACSGMYLLGYGVLFGTIILSVRVRQKALTVWSLIAYYVLLMILIIWGNIVRIYVLVVSNIEAGHWMHESVGLLLFVLQILVPFFLIVNRKSIRTPTKQLVPHTHATFPVLKYLILAATLSLMIFIISNRNSSSAPLALPSVHGYKLSKPSDDVAKLSNNDALIYIKKPVAAYSADHNPMVCWSGSGYSFKHIEQQSISGKIVNTATLKKGNDVLYSSWWFESKTSRTHNQWYWRWRALKQEEHFYLINVTCSTREKLDQQINTFFENNLIAQL